MFHSETAAEIDLSELVSLMQGRRSVVLAGAGCSTESGIPDYRGPEGRLRARKPVQYGDFVRSMETRQRYWARSTVGWGKMRGAEPNPAHHALADLERTGHVTGLITQNVDGLHHQAGSRNVIELHGSLRSVICLDCGEKETRSDMQTRLEEQNPHWLGGIVRAESAPDGDAELGDHRYAGFVVPGCDQCEGTLKPDVVFFGENVPKLRVEECWRMVDRADLLLVVGSSLTVYSGRRFVYGAVERALPIGVVNLGPTRADDLATAKVEAQLGNAMPRLVEALQPS
jgi:NAD-dependent SIR2 family protein deacetylase